MNYYMGCKQSHLSTLAADQTADQTKMSNLPPSLQLNKSLFISTGILGEGGFGKVLAGMFVKNGQWYAVKEVKKTNLVKHKSGVEMLFGEVDAMKRLSHSFVINLHASFHDKMNCYLVLDLKTGGDLRYYLRKRYLFEERDTVFMVACLTSALEHMHSRNIIHRDVKPENIIFDEKGYPYLTDFGVAYAHPTPSTPSEALACNLASGTKQYLAPEVFTRAHIHGPEVDYWSLGVIVYEILFGKRPFEKHCPIPMIQYLEKAMHTKKKHDKHLREQQQHLLQMQQQGRVNVEDDDAEFRACLANALPRIDTNPAHLGAAGSGATSNATSNASSPVSQSAYSYSHSMLSQSPGWSLPSMHSPFPSMPPSPSLSPCISYDHNAMVPSNLSQSTRVMGHNPHYPASCTPPRPKKHATHNMMNMIQLAMKKEHQKDLERLPEIIGGGGSGAHSPIGSPSPTTTRSLFMASSNSYKQSNHHYVQKNGKKWLTDEDEGLMKGQYVMNQHCDLQEREDEEDDDDDVNEGEEEEMQRALPGDHWLVDDGELPDSLIVTIPIANPWLGQLSNECLDVMHGLLECRPSHRLGCRNLDALVNSDWFVKYHLQEEEMLLTRMYAPTFQPGKRFLKETMNRLHQHPPATQQNNEGDASESGSSQDSIEESLTAEEEEQFTEFTFVSSSFGRYFTSSHVSAVGTTVGSSSSSSR